MSELVADIIRKQHAKGQPAQKVIYLDCSRHLTSHNQFVIWRSMLQSLILQFIHVDPEAAERLQQRLVRTGHKLDSIFAKHVNGLVQSSFELLLNALRLVRPSNNDGTYVFIDKLDEVANPAWKIRLHDLAKWPTEVDRAIVSSRESEHVQEAVESDFVRDGIRRTFLIISQDAEARGMRTIALVGSVFY